MQTDIFKLDAVEERDANLLEGVRVCASGGGKRSIQTHNEDSSGFDGKQYLHNPRQCSRSRYLCTIHRCTNGRDSNTSDDTGSVPFRTCQRERGYYQPATSVF